MKRSKGSVPGRPGSAEQQAGAIAQARDLVKVYGRGEAQARALDGVSIEFTRGEMTAIMGPSGSGKSTLMHCLAALDSPTSGSVVVDGVEVAGLRDRDLRRLRRERVGFVAQADQTRQLLVTIYGLLALSVVIAVLGIINTLALSVFERVREIGLLRAVGMTRSQLARVITIESVLTALFGAVLGTALGLGLGVALRRALVDDGLVELVVPFGPWRLSSAWLPWSVSSPRFCPQSGPRASTSSPRSALPDPVEACPSSQTRRRTMTPAG